MRGLKLAPLKSHQIFVCCNGENGWKSALQPVDCDFLFNFLEHRADEVRADIGLGSEPMKAKIADADKAKVHTMFVIGQRDLEAGAVSMRLHGKGNVGAKPRGEAIAGVLEAIRLRSL